MITRTKLTLLLTFSCLTSILAQVKESEIQLRDKAGQVKIIKLKETKVSDDLQAVNILLKSQYHTDEVVEFKSIKQAKTDKLGFKVEKLQQYYKGIKVEFSVFNAISKDGLLTSINGKYLSIKNLAVTPKLTEKEALLLALDQIGAEEYIWEDQNWEQLLKKEKDNPQASYYPKGELVIFEKEIDQSVLSYKFTVTTLTPFSSNDIYVNAESGKIIYKNSLLRHVVGTADTRYSGQRNIETEQTGTQFRLRDNTRGNGIQTFSMRDHGNNYADADDILDNNNNWTALEYDNANQDNAALDAHWGAMMTYDYFLQEHERNSIDDNGFVLRNYVHADLRSFDPDFTDDNAFWWMDRMTYGDGETQFDAVVSLDVIAHEIGHGFYDKAVVNALYERESGAINEGLSDIWGAMVEAFAAPEKDIYLIGEDITLTVFALRSMSDPHARFQPDTYGDNDPFWFNPDCGTPAVSNDKCGVHINSGVLNYWFFLLAEGDTGTNENGDFYTIDGIGRESAAQIVYRAQTTYFTPSTNFEEARIHTLQAAEDLFGSNSLEAVTTNNAWNAVGIGNLIIGQLEGDNSACFTPNTTFTLANFTNQAVNWQTSPNLVVVNSNNTNNTNITVRASTNSVHASGFVIANIGNDQVRKDIWVGKPSSPNSNISGSTTVAYGAYVMYSDPSVSGATSYKWYLPYPYEPNATVTINPLKWGIIDGGNSRNLQAIVGPNDGLVQFMGVNTCGTGGAKTLNISLSSSNGGGGSSGGKVSPGGGNIPLSLGANINEGIIIYPNPVDDRLNVITNSDTQSEITLYDINSNIVYSSYTKNTQKTIDLSNLKNGVYFLKIIGENNVIQRIIVQH